MSILNRTSDLDGCIPVLLGWFAVDGTDYEIIFARAIVFKLAERWTTSGVFVRHTLA